MTSAVYFAGIPKGWSIQRFVNAINSTTSKEIGESVLFETEQEAIQANVDNGAKPDHFTVMTVSFEKDSA